MPGKNCFRHQTYRKCDAEDESVFLEAPPPTPAGSAEFSATMTAFAERLRGAGVGVIYLVHGSFVGKDALGVTRKIGSLAPSLAAGLEEFGKRIIDALTQDAGNYTEAFASTLEKGLAEAGYSIPVRLLYWSSENHHVGRADGAIRLLEAIASESADGRLLLWCHSHGGNLAALASNLLAGDKDTVQTFFRAARSYYRWPLVQRVDLPRWQRVRDWLVSEDPLERKPQLDVVTFGTPVRYGWDLGGVGRLMHFVHHRPAKPPCRAKFPLSLDDLQHAQGGDVLQHLGIAGTNFRPTLWAWRTLHAERQLRRLLEPGIRKRDLLDRLKLGRRAHEDGLNLFVDYCVHGGSTAEQFGGHAIYTRIPWLRFHAEQIAQRLYAEHT